MKADFILIDDRLGRQEAKRLGLTVAGALGILEQAWVA
jgi:predicted nucleic acid-binding protein